MNKVVTQYVFPELSDPEATRFERDFRPELRSIAFDVPGEPVAFARAASNGVRRFTPDKQRAYMQAVGWLATKAMAVSGQHPFTGAVSVTLTACYAYPKSWPQKRRDGAVWKTSAPDIDNLTKLSSDAMNGIVYSDDAHVVRLVAEKKYGPEDGLSIEVSEVAQ